MLYLGYIANLYVVCDTFFSGTPKTTLKHNFEMGEKQTEKNQNLKQKNMSKDCKNEKNTGNHNDVKMSKETEKRKKIIYKKCELQGENHCRKSKSVNPGTPAKSKEKRTSKTKKHNHLIYILTANTGGNGHGKVLSTRYGNHGQRHVLITVEDNRDKKEKKGHHSHSRKTSEKKHKRSMSVDSGKSKRTTVTMTPTTTKDQETTKCSLVDIIKEPLRRSMSADRINKKKQKNKKTESLPSPSSSNTNISVARSEDCVNSLVQNVKNCYSLLQLTQHTPQPADVCSVVSESTRISEVVVTDRSDIYITCVCLLSSTSWSTPLKTH